jgi:hypothetical protein
LTSPHEKTLHVCAVIVIHLEDVVDSDCPCFKVTVKLIEHFTIIIEHVFCGVSHVHIGLVVENFKNNVIRMNLILVKPNLSSD